MSSLLRLTNKFLFLSSHQRREFFLQRFCFLKNLHSTWPMVSLSVVKCQFALWSVLFEFEPTNDGKITQHKINGQIFTKENQRQCGGSHDKNASMDSAPIWMSFTNSYPSWQYDYPGVKMGIDCLGELNKYAWCWKYDAISCGETMNMEMMLTNKYKIWYLNWFCLSAICMSSGTKFMNFIL